MSLNAAELHAVLAEIEPRIAGASVRDVGGCGDDDVVLRFERAGERTSLLVSFREGLARAHVATRPAPPGAPEPSSATLRLGALLRGAVLVGVDRPPGDRTATFRFERGGEHVSFRIELFAKHGNWIAAGADGVVLALRTPVESSRRILQIGKPDAPPAPPPFAPPPSRFDLHDPRGVNAAVEAHYGPLADRAMLDEAIGALRRRIEGRLANRRDRAHGLERRLEESKQAADLRRRAELLNASRRSIPRGAAEAVVVDYYDPSMPTIRIELDPARSAAETAERMFARARKLEDGAEAVRRELASALDDAARLENALLEVSTLGALDDAARAADRFERDGLLPAPKRRVERERGRTPAPGHRRYISADGLEILVGKNAAENDRLTFHTARGHDLWLHVGGGFQGSHVVVRLPKDSPAPQETFLDAAVLAIHFSSRRGSARCEVIVTERKHVQKIRGAPPGKVAVTGERRVLIDVEPARLERLLRPRAAGSDLL